MSMRLSPCHRCARHVKADATACPFCGARVPPTDVVPARATAERLSRAALFAAGVGAAAVVTSCGSPSVSVTPPYGLAPIPIETDDAGSDASDAAVPPVDANTASDDAPSFVALYGGVALVDGGLKGH